MTTGSRAALSLPTPVLVVDPVVLDHNITAMAERASRIGADLRPHAKTHKVPEIADRQVSAGATGLTVATVAEAEVFFAAGFDDLFIAYPLWVDRARAARLRDLVTSGATLRLGTDCVEAARTLAAQLGTERSRVSVLVEVDSGHHRTGVAPDLVGPLAEQVAALGLDLLGAFTFPGHGYSPGGRRAAAEAEVAALAAAGEEMAVRGLDVRVLSGGSTPTVEHTGPGAASEIRPGVYVFGDAQQLELGSCSSAEIGLVALSTVVSRADGRVILDAGSKVLGADRPAWASGFGRLLDHPAARVSALSEHHATVAWGDGGPLPRVGDRLRVVPNHVCAAVNLADELVLVHDDEVVDRWPVAARGANT